MDKKNYGLRMAIWRTGEPIYRIAQDLQIHPSQLSGIIHGKRAATPREQKRLVQLLDVPLRELFPDAAPAEAEVKEGK